MPRRVKNERSLLDQIAWSASQRASVRGMTGILALAGLFCIPASAQEPCRLQAYAHNDYENRRPLLNAVESGYSGVEVDYYLVNGQLLVGHDLSQLSRDRTLQSLYLEPLRDLARRQGPLCGPEKRFLLNIEAKQTSRAAFDSLQGMLSRYPDLFGPHGWVEVILVGWTPPIDSIGDARIQYRVERVEQLDSIPPDPRITMISVRFSDLLRYPDRSTEFRQRMTALVRQTRLVPNRRLRVYEVPYDSVIYRALLNAGVDLIGVKNLGRGRNLLNRVSSEQ